jgi:hypothetical protein
MAKVELSSGVIGLRFVKRVEYVRFSEPVHGQPLNRRMRIGTLPGGMSTRKKPKKTSQIHVSRALARPRRVKPLACYACKLPLEGSASEIIYPALRTQAIYCTYHVLS